MKKNLIFCSKEEKKKWFSGKFEVHNVALKPNIYRDATVAHTICIKAIMIRSNNGFERSFEYTYTSIRIHLYTDVVLYIAVPCFTPSLVCVLDRLSFCFIPLYTTALNF